MTTTRRILLLILCAGATLAQADTERRDLVDFNEVAAASGIRVELRQSAAYSVTVEADDLDEIVTEVSGNSLRLYRASNWNWFTFGLIDFFIDDSGGELSATVTLPSLARVRSMGGADIRGSGTFTGDRIELRSSGGSNITLELAMPFVDASSSGGSTMHLSGSAQRGVMQSSGGSRLDAAQLDIADANLHSSGGSRLGVGDVEKLTARASGGSDIRYDGDPVNPDIHAARGADIIRR